MEPPPREGGPPPNDGAPLLLRLWQPPHLPPGQRAVAVHEAQRLGHPLGHVAPRRAAPDVRGHVLHRRLLAVRLPPPLRPPSPRPDCQPVGR